ncbi:MAG: hypothetical protein PVH11_08385 [Anaerolineae bacterium]
MTPLGSRWMNPLCCIFLAILLLAASGCQRYDRPDLRQELLVMLEEDQRIRQEHLVVMTTATPPHEVFVPREELGEANQELFEQMKALDEAHTARMKEIVDQYGWPGYSLVGEDGSDAAWVLIQHSDDLSFQKRCLELLTKAADQDEADWRHVAYLTDRVLVAQGKAQIYGTQFRPEQGRMVPFPIQDEEEVDVRRKSLGLSPLEEYSWQMNQHLESTAPEE